MTAALVADDAEVVQRERVSCVLLRAPRGTSPRRRRGRRCWCSATPGLRQRVGASAPAQRRPARRGIACTSCRCRRGRDRCGRPPGSSRALRSASRAARAASASSGSRRAMRRAIAAAARHWPSAMQLRSSEASCGERAIASEKRRGQRGDLVGRHGAAEVVQAVEAERLADRIRGLEREAVGQLLRCRRRMPYSRSSSGRCVRQIVVVLGLDELDARVLQRVEQAARAQREAAVAHAHAVVVPEPLRAQVVAVEKRRVPGLRVDDVAVPLDQQHVRRVDDAPELLQHELRVRVARGEALDRARRSMPSGSASPAGRPSVTGTAAREADLPPRQRQRTQRQRVVHRVDAAERDGGEVEHRRFRLRPAEPRHRPRRRRARRLRRPPSFADQSR